MAMTVDLGDHLAPAAASQEDGLSGRAAISCRGDQVGWHAGYRIGGCRLDGDAVLCAEGGQVF
jgi:hypothetical protein